MITLFNVSKIDDIPNIPKNVTQLIWSLNEPVDILEKFSNLTHIFFANDLNYPIDAIYNLDNLRYVQFFKFYALPFRIPKNLIHINIYDENEDLFSSLYLNYSEYLIDDNLIKVGDSIIELVLDGDYVKEVIFRNEDSDISWRTPIEEITFDDIEEFLSPGINIKPAKN